MFLRGLVLMGLIAGLVACGDGFKAKTITTEADFRSEIVGRTLSNGAVTLRVLSPGVLGGVGRGGPVLGTWQWRDGQFCRNIVSGGRVGNGCQTVVLAGTAVTFLEASGGVGSQTYFLTD